LSKVDHCPEAKEQRCVRLLAERSDHLKVWRDLRGSLERRQMVRTLGRRFRRDPVAYLRSFEESLIKQALPP